MTNLTSVPTGASFACGDGGSQITRYSRWVEPDELAANLLEYLSEALGDLLKLPPGYPIPPAVLEAVQAAHDRAAEWTDLQHRKPRRPSEV